MRWWVCSAGGVIMVVAGMTGPAAAQLAAPQTMPPRTEAETRAAELTSSAAKADMVGNSSEALRLADAAIKANRKDGWAHYDRAEALQEMNRIAEAVVAYREAERDFGAGEAWAKSVAIYGEARALAQGGLCADARAEYERYASFVQRSDPKSADIARRYAKDCAIGQPQQQPPRQPAIQH